MISRYLFVSLYFFSFFLLNRWNDFYTSYFQFASHRTLSIDKLTVKQLQYILNVRTISFAHINDKHDLVQLVKQTGESR